MSAIWRNASDPDRVKIGGIHNNKCNDSRDSIYPVALETETTTLCIERFDKPNKDVNSCVNRPDPCNAVDQHDE